jgi:hypothetical protein
VKRVSLRVAMTMAVLVFVGTTALSYAIGGGGEAIAGGIAAGVGGIFIVVGAVWLSRRFPSPLGRGHSER